MMRGSIGSRLRSAGIGAAAAALLGAGFAGCGKPALELPRTATWRIVGEVADGAGRPVAGAGVVLFGSPRGALTDAAGRFTVERVFPGPYGLSVLHAGFRSAEAPLAVGAADTGTYTLAMTRDRALSAGLSGARPDSMPPITVSVRIEQEP